jgi:glycosyltransferase involved in cell wall biosynthesis
MPRLRQPGEPHRVLLVGGLSPAKGVIDLLEAVRRVGSGVVRVLLVGRITPGTNDLLAPYRHLFDHLPPMPQDELARCYHRADVFCLPSFFEGSALVVHEAMASGLPCVVTPSAGSAIEHMRDGWIVPAGAPGEIASALDALLADPALRARLGAAARRTAESHDVASYGRRLVAAYSGTAVAGVPAASAEGAG